MDNYPNQSRQRATIAIPYLWLSLFFLAPLLIALKVSFSEATQAMPPYLPLFGWEADVETGEHARAFMARTGNYAALSGDGRYLVTLLSSLKIAATSAMLALVIGFPMAYAMARAQARVRLALLMLVVLPLATSLLIRTYGWIGILKTDGLLNLALGKIGIIDSPLNILYTDVAVYVGMICGYLPLMVLPIFASLVRLDRRLVENAIDLGCHPLRAFWLITFRFARPGIVVGCLLVFIPAFGEFVIPELLGGADTQMIGRTLWIEFFDNRNWPLAAAIAMAMLALLLAPTLYLRRQQVRILELDTR